MGCTFVGNSAQFGGGLDVFGSMTMTNTTVTGNFASETGGGIGSVATMTLDQLHRSGQLSRCRSGRRAGASSSSRHSRSAIRSSLVTPVGPGPPVRPTTSSCSAASIDASSSYNVIGTGARVVDRRRQPQSRRRRSASGTAPGQRRSDADDGPARRQSGVDAGSNALVPGRRPPTNAGCRECSTARWTLARSSPRRSCGTELGGQHHRRRADRRQRQDQPARGDRAGQRPGRPDDHVRPRLFSRRRSRHDPAYRRRSAQDA